MQVTSAPYCAAWDVPPAAPAFTRAVHSAARALLIGGTLDPVTPIGFARDALRTPPNGVLLERRDAGHGAGLGEPAGFAALGWTDGSTRPPQPLSPAQEVTLRGSPDTIAR